MKLFVKPRGAYDRFEHKPETQKQQGARRAPCPLQLDFGAATPLVWRHGKARALRLKRKAS
jgi:hypothetical protein